VFVNLLLNARDAMRGGGAIKVEARPEGEQVRVTVTDEGSGIAKENLERIFEPFFTTKGERGTGLGLSIARNVMDRLGGKIVAENRAQGGAQLTLTFPMAPRAPAAPARPVEPASATEPPERKRILLVDDDPDNLEALGLVLARAGHEVVAAASGPEALAGVERGERYDVAFCDVGMPEMNGWDVVGRIRALAPGLRVYLVTGWAHEIPADDPRRADVAGVLLKPLDLDELYRCVTES
jgi:CheY-like chemotaxis protein